MISNETQPLRLQLSTITTCRRFIPAHQMAFILELCRESEEREFFVQRLIDLEALFQAMPQTGETDGQGDAAIVQLHYFGRASDWYITERDMEFAQYQAWGLARMQCEELGYISIVDLCRSPHVEIDLHWTPKTIGECRKG